MPSTGLNGRPILILDEHEASILLNWLIVSGHPLAAEARLKSQALGAKICRFVEEAAAAVTQPTFADEPSELQKLMSRASYCPEKTVET